MNCVNTSHPDFRDLLDQVDMSSALLAARIGVWMDNNTNERFPTVEEIGNKSTVLYQIDPVKAMAQKYNMNTAGYMSPNVNLYQVKQEAAKFGITVEKAASGSYFFKKNGRKINPIGYKQLESDSEFLPEKELTNKLLEWAELHGIEVVAMQEMISRFSSDGNIYDGATGVTDLLNSLIGIEASKEKIDTLAEEISHFATAILRNDPSVKRAMESIVDTEIYKEVKETYKDVYVNENDFRKEAVDKLLAQAIVQDFQENESNRGILPYLKAIFNKFFRKINGIFSKPNATEQIKNDLYSLAQSILNNEYIGKLEKEEVVETARFYQIEKEEEDQQLEDIKEPPSINEAKIKFLNNSIAQLEERLGLLKKKEIVGDSEEKKKASREESERFAKQILDIKKQILAKQLDAGVSNVVNIAENEFIRIKQVLTKYKQTGNIDGNNLNLIKGFTEMYNNLFTGLTNMLHRENYPQDLTDALLKELETAQKQLQIVEGMNSALIDKNGEETIDRGNIDAAGNKIDPDLDSKVLTAETREDISYWRLFVGNLKFSQSKILNTALKIIADSIHKVKRFTVATANDVLAAQDLMERNSKYKVESFIQKDSTGRRTQYLIREENWMPFFEAKKKAEEEIATKFGKEDFNQVHYELLTQAERVIYSTILGKVKKEYLTQTADEHGNFIGNRPKARNLEFVEMMKNKDAKLYYDMLLAKKREAINKLPKQYRSEHSYYRIPGIRSQFLERMTDMKNSFLTNIQEIGKESFFIDQDDTQFGEVSQLNNKMIPIFFTKEFDNPANVSADLSRSFTVFAEMAENFREMNMIAGDMETVRIGLGGRDFIKGKIKKKGVESKEYQALDILMDSTIYGIQKKDFKTIKIGKHNLSPAKLVDVFTKYIRTNNLALNITTSTAGYLKGTMDSILEDQIGLYTTVESKNWARLEYGKNLTHVMLETGQRKQTNKMHLLFQLSNIIEVNRMLQNSNKNKFARKIVNKDLLFLNYQTADYAMKGRISLAIFDNHRLYDGNYINRKDFLELNEKEGINKKEAKKEWATLRDKSLYNAYEVVNGQLQVKAEFKDNVTDAVLNRVVGTVEHVTHIVDGTMGDLDKGSLSRGVFGDFLLMHRGWFINTVDTRVMPPSFNMQTGQEEVGSYWAVTNLIRRELIGKGLILQPAQYGQAWNNLSVAKKRGVKRATLDFIYLNIIAFLASLANLAADDDDEDDWTTQYTAYQLNRVLLEQSAGAPWKLGEILQMIDEPVVGVRTIKDLTDLSEIWNTERFESGMYKESTHAWKWLVKRSPVKSLYEIQFPKMKNQFIKQVVDSPIYNWMADNEDEIQGLSTLDRLKSFLGMQTSYDEQNIYNDIEALEEYDSE